jgi:1-acyl-sn-glycerol-3-phosphate acyltransferase
MRMTRLHQPKAGVWIRLCVVLIYPFDSLLFRIRWRHLERVPSAAEGGVIIAMNHISIVDTVLMARFVWQSGRIPRFLIKAGVFDVPGIGRIMRGAKQIPVYRGTADASQSLREAVVALERGEAVIIYPEGTITRDPAQWPMQGKTGIARLVLLSPDTPVVPVGQWGAQQRKSQPWWRKLGRRRAGASVGMPMDLSRYRGCEPTSDTLREITDVIMAGVREQVAELRGEPAPRSFFAPPVKYVDKTTKIDDRKAS